MTDYSELKAACLALAEGSQLQGEEATDAMLVFEALAGPDQVLALVQEVEEDAMHMRAFGDVMKSQAAQIEQLKAEVVRLRSDNEAWRLTVEAERHIQRVISGELERLRGPNFAIEIEALRKDAERYRWLRGDTSAGKVDFCIMRKHWREDALSEVLTLDEADQQIDVAMSKGGGQ